MICWQGVGVSYAGVSTVNGRGWQPSTGGTGWKSEPACPSTGNNEKYSPVSWSSVCEVVWFKDREDPSTVKSDRPTSPPLFLSTALFWLTVVGTPYWAELDLFRRERAGEGRAG